MYKKTYLYIYLSLINKRQVIYILTLQVHNNYNRHISKQDSKVASYTNNCPRLH